jgi:predicted metal-binding membrane protein
MMASASAWLSGGLLIAAGVYQWVPVKDVCLEKCRAPLQFFLFNWRPGTAGAFRMGVKHGGFCVGCCWILMLILFAVGVMNLLWVAVIAGFVLAEKLLPAGRLVGRTAGIALAAAGGYLIAAG